MSYGLVNAPSYFQSFMNDVFRDMLDRFVIVYIDDIMIYLKSLSEHVKHVKRVLHRQLDHGLHTKAETCDFHQAEISIIGS